MPDTERIRTFDLSNFNMASDALQRASRIASVYDMVDEAEQVELRKALVVEMQLARRLMDMVEIEPGITKQGARKRPAR